MAVKITRRKKKHGCDHTWEADRWRTEYAAGGGRATMLQIQCTTCGVAEEKRIAKFAMTKEQVERYVALQYPKSEKPPKENPWT